MSKLIKAKDFIEALDISKATFYRGIKSNTYPYNCHLRLGCSNRIFFPEILLTELCTNALKGANKDGGIDEYHSYC
jgi:hypothetical protein